MVKPLDQTTYNLVDMVIRRSRRSGLDPIDELNKARLIWSPHRQDQLQLEAVEDLCVEFDEWRPAEFLRLVSHEMVGSTPTDMHRAIDQWLRDYVAHMRKKL